MKIYQVWDAQGFGDDVCLAIYTDHFQAMLHLRALNERYYGDAEANGTYCIEEYETSDYFVPGEHGL